MTPEQFVYWLQGKLEDRDPIHVTEAEIQMIQEHLKTVFEKKTPDVTPSHPIPYTPYPPLPLEESNDEIRERARASFSPNPRIIC